MSPRLLFLFAVVVGLAGSAAAVGAVSIEARPVKFAKGASSATIKGSIKGDKIIDYKLGARAGQTMSVTLKASNASTYFNVLPPGSNDVAVFVGSTSGNQWTGRLEADGEYTVRVYLMRSAARRNEASSYTLAVGIAGEAAAKVPLGTAPASDAKVKGTPYHATGQVPCSMGSAAPGSAQCDFGVIRGKPGNAEVHVMLPGGSRRVLTFLGDKASADGGAAAKAVKSGDGMWSVDVGGKEHYRIPDAVISGG
jgi:hypothetical protein